MGTELSIMRKVLKLRHLALSKFYMFFSSKQKEEEISVNSVINRK